MVLDLGFDNDEVISDTFGCLRQYLWQRHKFSLPHQDWQYYMMEDNPQIPLNIIQDINGKFQDPEFMSTVTPYPDAIKALKLLNTRGHRIHIVTARSDELALITQKQLMSAGIKISTLHIVNGSEKAEAIADLGLDAFFDDALHVIEGFFQKLTHYPGIIGLMVRPWNRWPVNPGKLKPNFYEVYDWFGNKREPGIINVLEPVI